MFFVGKRSSYTFPWTRDSQCQNSANSLAGNSQNARQNFSPICLPKPKSFEFLKKNSLWMSVLRDIAQQCFALWPNVNFPAHIWVFTEGYSGYLLKYFPLYYCNIFVSWVDRNIVYRQQHQCYFKLFLSFCHLVKRSLFLSAGEIYLPCFSPSILFLYAKLLGLPVKSSLEKSSFAIS